MKKLFLFFAALTLSIILQGCYIDSSLPYVEACASTRYTQYYVGETVEFDNCSLHADTYFWDFGDGFTSRSKYPSTVYTEPGTYQVSLTAYSDNGRDQAYLTIKVLANTTLDVLVMYKGTSDPVSNCAITLYTTNQDWVDLKNPFLSATSNVNGSVIFDGLNSVRYYVDAYKKVSDLTYYGNDNLPYATTVLQANKITYFDVYVELLTKPSGKKSYSIVELKQGNPNHPLRLKNAALMKK